MNAEQKMAQLQARIDTLTTVNHQLSALVQDGTLAPIHALVAKYRQVSPSPSQQMYVRDVEIALGMDLPAVTDRDGRSNW